VIQEGLDVFSFGSRSKTNPVFMYTSLCMQEAVTVMMSSNFQKKSKFARILNSSNDNVQQRLTPWD